MACYECGEIDITPCTPLIPVDPIPYNKCNPCKKISCKQKLDSECVIYNLNQGNCGQGLSYLKIQNNTSIEDVVEKIDLEFDRITKPTLITCFAQKSNINLTTYRLNDVLLKLQEGYCNQIDLSIDSIQTILETIRDTPSLKTIFCEIMSTCE